MRLSDFRTNHFTAAFHAGWDDWAILLLPAVTYLLVRLMSPHPSIALGMLLVAAHVRGKYFNFITHFARGNTALSVAMFCNIHVGSRGNDADQFRIFGIAIRTDRCNSGKKLRSVRWI
ncbi:MAG: hypothetical protein R3C26_10300 [Calditrichia bacterium]